eukprot:1250080-Amphidinium_carterae.1
MVHTSVSPSASCCFARVLRWRASDAELLGALRPESIGDAPCLQPTFMVFAPAVLDKVYQS